MYVMGGGKKLLLPLLTFSLIGMVVHDIRLLVNGDTNIVHFLLTPIKDFVLTGSIEGNLPLWFLSSLFVVKLFFAILRKREINMFFILLVSCLLAFVQHIVNNPLPIYFGNICSGLFFYATGVFIMKNNYQNNSRVFAISVVIFCVMAFLGNPAVVMRTNELLDGAYLLWLVYSIAGCIFINKLMSFIPCRNLLEWIGKNSMPIYLTHWIVIELFNMFVHDILEFELTGVQRFAILLCVMVIVEPVIVWLLKSTRLRILMVGNEN